MRRLGLRSRVVLAAVFVLAIGVLIIGVTINLLLTNRLIGDAQSVLLARADAQLTTVVEQGGRVVVREGTGGDALDREAWVFAGGREIARPVTSADVERAARTLASARSTTFRLVPGHEVRLLARPARARDGRQFATIVVGITLTPYEQTERLARVGTLVLGLFVVLSGAWIAWRSIGAGLRPVAEMARRAEDYGEHDLSARFDLGPPRDELTTLAATLDGLLGRLEASLRHEQRLSAEIAHELRTPLSGVRAAAELGLNDAPTPAMREVLDSVIASADRMDGVIAALLNAARDREGTGATCAVDEAVRRTVDALATTAAEQGVTITLTVADADLLVGADDVVVSQSVNPLLENAIRHARRHIEVRVEQSDRLARVIVQDDGPGITDADADAIFRPGWQTAGGSGAGLGLALARRLASSLGGSVRADPSESGARVILELPLITAVGGGV
jgi:signal transduction histidine kinase